MAFEFIQPWLQERQQQGLLRQAVEVVAQTENRIQIQGEQYINFSSNDYLGLADTDFQQEVPMKWRRSGSAASPLVTGRSDAHVALESALADWLEREAVLLFSSGFAANSAICQALMLNGGVILADKLVHASMVEGMQHGKGQFRRFRHNDVEHLQQLLERQVCRDKLVLAESTYSMDGDYAPLTEMVSLCSEHDAWLMVDDAHGFGVLGTDGMGCVEQWHLSQQHVPVLMGTFGKAVGSSGAFVAGSRDLIDYIQNTARHYIYSTMTAPWQAALTLSQLNAVREQGWRRDKLRANILLFRQLAQQAGLPLMLSDSPIQPIVVGQPHKTLQVADMVRAAGFWVGAMREPTVPKGTDRLRVTINTLHKPEQIQRLIQEVCRALENAGEY